MKANALVRTIFIVAGFFAANTVIAGTLDADAKTPPASQTPQTSSYGELELLRSQNAILTEKLRNAELRSKVSMAEGSSSSGSSPPISTRQAVVANVDRGARVSMVAGSTGQLAATIQMSDGGNIIARVGTRIAALGVVRSVTTEEVLVSNGKDILSIPFANATASMASSASPYGINGAPSLSGGPMVPPMSVLPGSN